MTAAELRPLVLSLPRAELQGLFHQLQDAIAAEEGFELVNPVERLPEGAAHPANFRQRDRESVYTWGEVMAIIELRHAARA